MSEPRQLRCYEYVNRPYARVREVLRERGAELFQRATSSASARADALVSTLRVPIGGVEIGVDVRIQIDGVTEEEWAPGISPVTRVSLRWEGARASGMFPAMKARLSAWPIDADETQLEIDGHYTPPLGVVGNAIDALVLHRIADAAVHRFLEDVVAQIQREAGER